MFGKAATLQDPIASFDQSQVREANLGKINGRGYKGSPASLTTALTGANNDLVITTKGIRPGGVVVSAQYGILAPTAPLALFEGGRPAVLDLTTSQGFAIAANFPGFRGNEISLQIVDPGRQSPLMVEPYPPGEIFVSLARGVVSTTTTTTTTGGPTTTTTVAPLGLNTTVTQLVAAINAQPGINKWVRAWVSDASKASNYVAPIAQTFFSGGVDIPYLVFVSVVANTSSVVSTIASAITTLLAGSTLVSSANAAANSGAGAVTVFGPLPLTGGYTSVGQLGIKDDNSQSLDLLKNTLGTGIGQTSNYGLEVRSDRMAAARTWRSVPSLDNALVKSNKYNIPSERGPNWSLFL